MSNIIEDTADSETSDEEYVPGKEDSDVSVEGSDNDDSEVAGLASKQTEKKSKGKKEAHQFKRKRKGGIKLDEEQVKESSESEEEVNNEADKAAKNEEEQKKKTDALWADFMSDFGGLPSKKKPSSTSSSSSSNINNKEAPAASSIVEKPKTEKKVSVTKVFDFAGEEVRVTKEVAPKNQVSSPAIAKSTESKPVSATKRAGISGILDKINKKPKMSVLDKSKFDWQSFKQDEGIENELEQYKKGKDGYLEKQDFLQRTDLRQFEIEKNLRLSKR